MSAHAYPTAVVVADAARAGAGLLLSAGALAVSHGPAWLTGVLSVIAGVFVLNALATARRALSAVDVEDEAIAVRGPWPARLRWDEVHRLRLAHYSTRRDGGGGWMQLTLAGRGRRLVVDSRIGGFDLLARRAVAAARRGRVRLDEATIANFRALGIEADAPGPGRARPQ
ncbi:MAG: hypothetical protein U0S49_12465 [Rhodospirillales bacterium]|nr:hypothetical protein [Rhodospirillales bacterium]